MGRTVEFCALAVPESHNLLKTSSDFSKTNSEFASIAKDSPLLINKAYLWPRSKGWMRAL